MLYLTHKKGVYTAARFSRTLRQKTYAPTRQFHLTECIHRLVLKSQIPHKIINTLFTMTHENIELTVSWGS